MSMNLDPSELSYCFSITAGFEPRVVGEVPGGIRVDLGYKEGKVLLRQPSFLSKHFGVAEGEEDNLQIGEISSGQDWILVGAVGSIAVADFDGRLTLRIRTPPVPKPEGASADTASTRIEKAEKAAKAKRAKNDPAARPTSAAGASPDTGEDKEGEKDREQSTVVGGHTRGRVDLGVSYADWLKGNVGAPRPVLLP